MAAKFYAEKLKHSVLLTNEKFFETYFRQQTNSISYSSSWQELGRRVEFPWISQVATVLANNAPSVTVLLNGGEITFDDAFSSINTGRLVVVIAGSGRTADILADALRGQATDERAKKLAKSGTLQYIDLSRAA
ncbi:hypothetical protein LC612_06235 [Nostoc sp. CHAB 5834]|nr:hypothetical protein [Nostoc sp. CHAB 5834]